MSVKFAPVEIKRQTAGSTGSGVIIRWSTGELTELDSTTLRKNCPCASCMELRGDKSHSKPLSKYSSSLRVINASVDEQIDLKQIWPVGNYAIGMRWGDKHDSGIYTYKLLRELGKGES